MTGRVRVRDIQRGNASGPFLKDKRLSLGLSRSEASKRIGCSSSTLGRYERIGITGSVRINRVFNVCTAYRVSPDFLLELAEQPASECAGTGV